MLDAHRQISRQQGGSTIRAVILCAIAALALALAFPAGSLPSSGHGGGNSLTSPKPEAIRGESGPLFLAEPNMHVWLEVGGTGSDAAWDRDFSRCSERFADFASGEPYARAEDEGHQLLIATCLRASGWILHLDYELRAPLWQPGGSVVM